MAGTGFGFDYYYADFGVAYYWGLVDGLGWGIYFCSSFCIIGFFFIIFFVGVIDFDYFGSMDEAGAYITGTGFGACITGFGILSGPYYGWIFFGAGLLDLCDLFGVTGASTFAGYYISGGHSKIFGTIFSLDI